MTSFEIDGTDIKVLEGSYYDSNLAAGLHVNTYDTVSAVVTDVGTQTVYGLDGSNVIGANVDTSIAGVYQTDYYYEDDEVSATKTLQVEVVASDPVTNAQIIASDNQVKLADAPTDVRQAGVYSPVFYYEETGTRAVSEAISATRPFEVEVIAAEEALENVEFTKEVIDRDGDNFATNNEILDYTITVSNTSSDIIFEDLILTDKLTSDDLNADMITNLTITNSTGEDVTSEFDIDLEDGISIVIDNLAPSEELIIEFSIQLNEVTSETIENIANLAVGESDIDSNRATIDTDYVNNSGNGGNTTGQTTADQHGSHRSFTCQNWF